MESGSTSGNGPSLSFSSAAGRWVLAATIVGSSVAMVTGTVVNVALPAIGDDLGAEVTEIQWVVNGYLVTLAALILVGGSLGDHYGRRRIYQVGVLWFATASLLCAVAPTVEVLIGARVLQGIGGALLTPGSLAIIQASFRPSDRSRAIGAWAALGGIGAAIGPLLGGYLIDAISWRAIFLLNLPLAAFVLYATARHVPESRDPDPKPLDRVGAPLAVLGLAGLTYGLIGAPDRGLGAPDVLGALLLGAGSLAAFLAVQSRSSHPMMPLSSFANRQFSVANGLTFIVYGALGGVFFLFVVFLQVVLGYSAVEAGAASLPITFLMLVLSERVGDLAGRIGPRLPLTAGSVLLGGGMLWMSTLDASSGYLTAILPALTTFGLGLSGIVAPVTSTVLAAAEDRHAGVASGINNAVARAAGLIAVAVLPWIGGLSDGGLQDPGRLEEGFGTAMLVSGLLALAGAVLAATMISDDVLEGEGEPSEEERVAVERGCAVDGPPPCWREREERHEPEREELEPRTGAPA